METSVASAGLTTMAFPGLIEGGLAEEGCRGVNVILFGGSIASRLFQLRTAGSGPPGRPPRARRADRDDLIKNQGKPPTARIRPAAFWRLFFGLFAKPRLDIRSNIPIP